MADESVSSAVTVADVALASLTSAQHPETGLNELEEFLVDLGLDPILKPLLGATTVDERVYLYYQPAAVIDSTHRAYITIAMTAVPPVRSAVAEPVFTLAIWAYNRTTLTAVRDRLVTRLRENTPIPLPSGRTLYVTALGERDSFQENTKFHGRNLQYTFGFSRVQVRQPA